MTLDSTPSASSDRWSEIALAVHRWAEEQAVELRDAVLLLPFVQLLPPARRAFAAHGGWMPRIETTQTLAASLGPAPPTEPGQISFDTAIDTLQAEQMLRSPSTGKAGAAWSRRDPRGFRRAAAAVVDLAHALARAAAALPPEERPAHWARARVVLAPASEPGATERALVRLALEWACLAPPPVTDRLFDLHPSGWIVVQAGGPDALGRHLMNQASTRSARLLIDTDMPESPTFDLPPARSAPALAVCDSFEQEAQCAAAQVLRHLCDRLVPVVLVAQDRVLVRRIRALLERRQVTLLDETGWKLSTTRAGAQVMALLKAAAPDAGTDALLDWLKAGTPAFGPAAASNAATSPIETLEADCRRLHLWRLPALDHAALSPGAATLWARASPLLRSLADRGREPLFAWLRALAGALAGCGALALLQADEAGRQLLRALHLDASRSPDSIAAAGTPLSLSEFATWVDDVLEHSAFRPSSADEAAPQVVITPLAQAILRPFAAMVFPGADDKHLGSPAPSHPLLGETQAIALGLPSSAERRAAECSAFAHALAVPHITFLHRRLDGANPLCASPLVERLALGLTRAGRSLGAWSDVRSEMFIVPTPIHRSAPAAAALLPPRFSASACEALRACPYRFFALNLLQLREDDELDGDIEKRDYGTWLHELLHRFHSGRHAPADAAAELAHLRALALAVQAEQGLDDAAFLPFSASFESLAPRYIAWLHERDAAGMQWRQGEFDLAFSPPALAGVQLRGRIDRVDAVPSAPGPALQLIDYKTGSAAGLKEKLRQPLEDTQLAVYAALMASQTDAPLQAIYLALDGSKGIDEVAHPQVDESARALVAGLAHDLQRLRGGAGLPALGEGATCAHCAARGVCRRDHWAASGAAPAAAATP